MGAHYHRSTLPLVGHYHDHTAGSDRGEGGGGGGGSEGAVRLEGMLMGKVQ